MCVEEGRRGGARRVERVLRRVDSIGGRLSFAVPVVDFVGENRVKSMIWFMDASRK